MRHPRFEEIDKLRQKIDDLQPIDQARLDSAFKKIRLDWNYHSNAMEGNPLTFGETKAFLLHTTTAAGRRYKDYQDIRGHNDVIEQLDDFVKSGEPLLEADIRQLHSMLLVEPYEDKSIDPNTGLKLNRRIAIGQYKTSSNMVITSTGVECAFASPAETPQKMQELMGWFRKQNEESTLHPIELAAFFHHQFVAIHPFDDGNGRMGRILMNLILMQSGFPPIVFRMETKAAYLIALEKASVGEYDDLIDYVVDAAIASLTIVLKAAQGETIDDLMDFDKQFALLSKTIETTNIRPNTRSADGQNELIRVLIGPIVWSVSKRFHHIEKHFSQVRKHLSLQKKETNSTSVKFRTQEHIISDLIAGGRNSKIELISLFFNATGYVETAAGSFMVFLKFNFFDSHIAITLQTTGHQNKEILTMKYGEITPSYDSTPISMSILATIFDVFTKYVEVKGTNSF